MKQADLWNMLKEPPVSVYTSIVLVSPDRLSPAASSSAMKTAEDTEDPDNPEGDNQLEYSNSSTGQI
jgi:hypothetical protein